MASQATAPWTYGERMRSTPVRWMIATGSLAKTGKKDAHLGLCFVAGGGDSFAVGLDPSTLSMPVSTWGVVSESFESIHIAFGHLYIGYMQDASHHT